MSHKKIKKILDQNPRLDYIHRCIRNINKDDFVKQVLNIDRNPWLIEFESLGDKNKDKKIFLFENDDPTMGFFATYRSILDSLYFSERFNLIPFIDLTSNFWYSEETEINNTLNPFEYYFEQVSDIPYEEVYYCYNIIRYKTVYKKLAEKLNNYCGYEISNIYINTMAVIAKKYIRLNSYIKPHIDNDISKILKGKKTIGVHVRGTDFKMEFNSHPIMVYQIEYIQYVKNVLADSDFEQIFLAADENLTIELFKNTFGNKLVYYEDVFRSDGIVSAALCYSDREHHKYLLGFEVLRDMITLANCDGLIAGLSSVSTCAQITKVSYDKKYEYIQVINKGISNKKITCRHYFNKCQENIRRKRM